MGVGIVEDANIKKTKQNKTKKKTKQNKKKNLKSGSFLFDFPFQDSKMCVSKQKM